MITKISLFISILLISCVSLAQSQYENLNGANAPCYFSSSAPYADVCILKNYRTRAQLFKSRARFCQAGRFFFWM